MFGDAPVLRGHTGPHHCALVGLRFCVPGAEAYNYNTMSDADPRNLAPGLSPSLARWACERQDGQIISETAPTYLGSASISSHEFGFENVSGPSS